MTAEKMTNLKEAVERIAALDAKRPLYALKIEDARIVLLTKWDESDSSFSLRPTMPTGDIMDFIAAAPQMAAIIRELWVERKQQRFIMLEARDVLETQRDKLYTLRRGLPSPWRNSCQDDRIGGMVASLSDALAALNSALGE